MRIIPFYRPQFCGHFDGRYLILIRCRSIVSSRKRKLRELFAVATDEDGIPNFDYSDPDALAITLAEAKFLNEADILQYVALFFSYKSKLVYLFFGPRFPSYMISSRRVPFGCVGSSNHLSALTGAAGLTSVTYRRAARLYSMRSNSERSIATGLPVPAPRRRQVRPRMACVYRMPIQSHSRRPLLTGPCQSHRRRVKNLMLPLDSSLRSPTVGMTTSGPVQ